MAKQSRKRKGLGVDAFGENVIDPTANVIALNEAANKRQDDLRKAERRYVESEIGRVKEVAELRASHVKEITTIHQVHDYALHKAEAGRTDALRANDREDVKALAIETGRTAETLQAQQTATAKALQESFATAMAEQNKERRQNKEETDRRLSQLELKQSEGIGKATVESPMMVEMVQELKALRREAASTSGRGQGAMNLWMILAVVISLIVGVGGLALALLKH